MSDPLLRLRVERLLRRDFKADDLIMLFLAAREMCGGRETVKEIGDFVAHKTDRTRGATTRELRNFLADFIFKCRHYGSTVPMSKLPPDFADIMTRCLSRANSQHLKSETGLVPQSATKLLPIILGRLKDNGDGSLSLSKPEDANELKLMVYLTTFTTVRPAFTAERLSKEFLDTLLVNQLVDQKELKELRWIKPVLGLFAIEHLHGSSVVLEDGSKVALRACAYIEGEELGVGAFIVIPRRRQFGRPLRVLHRSPVFTTGLSPDEWCEGHLSSRPFAPWWSRPLRISESKKLCLFCPDSGVSYASLGTRDLSVRVE